MSLLNSIKNHEGFSGTVYKDTKGFDTLGYGTKLPINEYEATLLLSHRLNEAIEELHEVRPFVADLPEIAQEIIYEMAYQLGVPRLLKFRKTLEYLENKDFINASQEMMESKWARKDAPNRAFELSQKMKEV